MIQEHQQGEITVGWCFGGDLLGPGRVLWFLLEWRGMGLQHSGLPVRCWKVAKEAKTTGAGPKNLNSEALGGKCLEEPSSWSTAGGEGQWGNGIEPSSWGWSCHGGGSWAAQSDTQKQKTPPARLREVSTNLREPKDGKHFFLVSWQTARNLWLRLNFLIKKNWRLDRVTLKKNWERK